MIDIAREAGLRVKQEVFADRGYNPDGTLVKRGTPGALHEDEEVALNQTLTMVREKRVRAIDGTWVPIQAETVCLHGDGAHALAFARRIRERLGAEGIAVRAATEHSVSTASIHCGRPRHAVRRCRPLASITLVWCLLWNRQSISGPL